MKKFHLFRADTQPMKKSLSCRKKSLGGHNKLARDCSVQIFRWSRWSSTWSCCSFFGKVRRTLGLAIYDHGYLTSPFYCKCPRDECLLDYLLGYVQSLKKDFAHNLRYAATQTFYSAQHMLKAFLHHYNTLLLSDKDEREDSKREEKWCKICHSGAEHKYVDGSVLGAVGVVSGMFGPVHGAVAVVLGMYEEELSYAIFCISRLSFSDDYVSLVMSDVCYLTARFYNGYPRNDSLSDKLVDVVQMLNKDFEYDLEGIIVVYSISTAPPEKICNLMESLCKKGKFASLKYTFWEEDIASEAFLHSFNNLHKDKDRVE